MGWFVDSQGLWYVLEECPRFGKLSSKGLFKAEHLAVRDMFDGNDTMRFLMFSLQHHCRGKAIWVVIVVVYNMMIWGPCAGSALQARPTTLLTSTRRT
jgi:hypothetical protein